MEVAAVFIGAAVGVVGDDVIHGADEDVAGKTRIQIAPELTAPAALFENVEQPCIEFLNIIRKNMLST
jgi:hypothetical protein